MHETDVGIRYVLSTVDKGVRQAISATTDWSKHTRASTQQVDAALRANDTAWKRTASIAASAQRKVADEQIKAATRVDGSLERQIAKLHKAGVGYKEIAHAARGWGATARETAAAVEKASAKEIASIDRVIARRNRLRNVVGLGPKGVTRGMGAEDRSLERGALGAASSRARLGAASLGGGLLAGIAGYVGVSAIKDSVDATKELALETRTLSAVTGMDSKTAAEWVAITQARGISSRTFGMSLKTLSTQTDQAMQGSKKSVKAFTDLGITYKEAKAHSHDLSGMLGLVADHLDKMPGGVRKTAIASQLLGRNWMALQPVLLQGAKGMAAQRQEAAALGVTLGGNAAENSKKLEEASVKLKVAQLGLEVQFAEHVAPAVMKVVGVGIKLFGVLRKELGPAVHFVTGEVKDASHWLGQHKDVLHGVEIGLGAVTAGFVGLKVINTGVRLVRGISSDFRTLASVVKAPLSLFKQQTSESVELAKANDALAKANVRLAASFDEVAASSKAAAGGEAMADEAALGGGGGMMPGGKAMAAEKGAGAGMATAREAEQAGGALTSETQQLGMFGMMFGREGAQSFLSRLSGGLGVAAAGLMGSQLIGGAIGGKTGSAVSAIGSGASVGAGLGMFAGPAGAVAGGLVGGAIGAVTHFSNRDPSFSIGPAAGLGIGKITSASQLQQQMAKAANAGNWKKLDALQTASGFLAKQLRGVDPSFAKKISTLSSAAAQASKQLVGAQLNQRVGGLESQLAGSKFKPSATQIGAATVKQLQGLPAQTQRMGAEAMIKFTAGLERNRKLPVGTTDKLIADLQKRYGPLLLSRLQADSAQSMKVISDQIKQSKVLRTVQDQVDAIHQKWSLLIPDTKVTAGNFVKVLSGDMTTLEGIIKHSTGKQHDEALAAYRSLRSQAGKVLGQMVTETEDKQSALTKAIQSGTAKAAQSASTNFWAMYQNIGQANQAGLVSTQKAAEELHATLDSTLKAFGGKPLPTNISVQNAKALGVSAKTLQLVARGATGVRVPGSPGPDSWTLVDGQGTPRAMVAGGELLVVNRHTEQLQDRINATVGAPPLGTLVAGERRPHSLPRMATGGNVGWQNVIASAESLGGLGYHSNPIQPYGYSELSVPPSVAGAGSALGHLPYQTHMRIRAGSREVVAAKQDIGAGSSFNPRMGLYPGTVQQLGLAGGEFHVMIERADGVPLTLGAGAAGGAGVPTIQVPVIRGKGTNADLARAAAKKMTEQANKYLQSHLPTGTGGAGGFMPTGVGGSAAHAAYAGLTSGRIDQGKDFGGAGPVGAIMPGIIKSTGLWPGWPGTGGVVYGTAKGNVYVMEDFAASVSAGQAVKADQVIGRATGGGSGIETGWANSAGTGPLTPYNGAADGTPMPGGIDFARFIGYATGGRVRIEEFSKEAQRAWRAGQRSNLPQHALGGHVDYAGMFGEGGAFTATRPTMAMFGDRGIEHVVAIPHAQLGLAGDLGWPSPPTKPHKPRHHHPRAPAGSHLSTALNPITDKVETHTASDWQKIRAEGAKERHDAAVAKKKYDAWLAQQVTDMLKVGGLSAGSIELTRKQANQAHLPLGHPFSLLGNVNALSQSGFKRVQSGLGHQLDINNLGQTLQLSSAFTRGMQRHGPDAPMFRLQSELSRRLDKIHDRIAAAERQRERLLSKSMASHGKQRQRLMDQWVKKMAEIQRDRRHAGSVAHRLATVGDKIAVSRPAQLANQMIGAGLKGLTSQFSNQQSQFDHDKTIAGLLEGAAPGMTLRKLLGPQAGVMLKAAGLTTRGARRLVGKGTDTPAAFAAQISELTKTEIPRYEQDAKQLHRLYQQALKTHNKKLQGSLLKQLDAVTQATLQAQSDLRAAQVASIEGKAQTTVDKATHASALAAAGQQGLTIAQQLGGVTGASADKQNADYITKAIVPSLKTELGALQGQEAAAKKAGDTTLADQIAEAIAGKQNDILQAQLDAQTAIKQATEDAAQATVDTANHAGAMADAGLQNLELQQQLSGTSGTPGGAAQISSYINSQILPALQGELTALQGQQAAAQAAGDTTLATQIAEAIAGKQNDILQAQLDEQTAIKEATQSAAQDLSELGGQLGVSYSGQQLPDLSGLLNGA